ncbi:MAG TPA: gamma-glutamyltransferase [Chitinophagaceae bacterium]|nr:gamma-glutamyltransferase [Chitinophagaceae bacterium]
MHQFFRYSFIIISLVLSIQVVAQPEKNKRLICATCTINPYKYVQVKSDTFQKASVSSAHPLASLVGAAIMKQGGNAFDAAIATQLALAVVYSGAGNLGGGGFLLARTHQQQLIALDYREKAPARAHRDMYLDKDGNAIEQLSKLGHLAAGVPGTIAGIDATLPYAKLPLKILIQPAIDLAKYGFVLTEREANNLNDSRAAFEQYNTQPTAFVKPTSWKAGDTLVQPELAATLERIQRWGAKGFYEGTTADFIVAEMQRGKGIITHNDLKNYKAAVRTPLVFNYRNHTIIGFPPPSSGGILTAQMLGMLERYPLRKYGFHNVKAVQLIIEAERRAYADRAEHMGDADFYPVPTQMLIDPRYLQQRWRNYDSTKATPSNTISAGKQSTFTVSEETTHISIIDADGTMVSITTTLNGNYGSKTVVGGAGFLLNNEMDDFSVKPGVANMYGAVGGVANAIAPNKRMLSSMTPTLVLKDNQPYLVVGTPGGTTIPTSVLQTLINIIDFDMSAAEAINAPKFHHQWLPDVVYVEKNVAPSLIEHLQAMGYSITPRGNIGRTEVIRVLPYGKRETAADIRGDDSVAGF